MSENLHDIDSIFRDSIGDKEELPPPHVWNELDRKLDKRKVASMAGKYHLMKWVAAALFMVSVGMAMYVYRVNKTASYADAEKKHPASSALPRSAPSGRLLETKPETPATRADPRSSLPSLTPDSQAAAPPVIKAPAGLPGEGDLASTGDARASSPAAARVSAAANPAAHSTTTASPPAFTHHRENVPGPEPGHRLTRADRVAASGKTPIPKDDKTIVTSVSAHPGREEAVAGLREILFSPLAANPVTRGEADPAGKMPPFSIRNILHDSLATASSTLARLSQPHAGGLTFTVFYSPNLVSTRIGNDGYWPGIRYPEDDAKQLKAKEKTGASWSAGAYLDYRFSNHWSVGSGLVLSTRTTEIKPKLIIAPASPRGEVRYWFNCSSGYSYIDVKTGNQQSGGPGSTPFNGDTVSAVSSTNKLQYMSVPLVMKYHFGEGKLRFYTGFGLQGNFLVTRKIETYLTKGNRYDYAKTSDIQGLRSMYLSGILTAGATYQISPSFGISLMPNAQLGIMSINEHAPVKSYVSFYGLGAGISIKL